MNKLVGVFVIIFEFFIQSSICLTCYVCNASIFNRNTCSNPNNLQSVICYPGRGCMVKYDSFGNPIQMGCNDASKYPVDFWGWPQCVETGCPLINLPWPFGRSKRHSRKSSESHESNGNSGTSTVCTCSQSLCNSAGLYNNVTHTPKINCLSCNGASACNSNSSKTVQCLRKNGCGVTYDVNKTAITRGCGGGLPLSAPDMVGLCLRYNTTMLCSCVGDRCNAYNYENQPRCSAGWTYDNVTRKCYLASPIINGYANASNYCTTNGGSLVSIHSLNQNNFITNNIVRPILNADNTTKGFYIGLRWESSSNHTWVWEDGTPTDFFRWLPGQPDGNPSNATYPANIARIIGQPPQVGYWDDINDAPTNTKRAICQM